MLMTKKYSYCMAAALVLIAMVLAGCKNTNKNDAQVQQELDRLDAEGAQVQRDGEAGAAANRNPLEDEGLDAPPSQPMRIQRIDETTEVQIVEIDEADSDNLSDGLMTPRRPDQPASYGQKPVVQQQANGEIETEASPRQPVPVVTREPQQPQQPAPQQPSQQTQRAAQLSADAMALARRIESAHGKGAWSRQEAIAMDIVVNFGGNKVVDARFTFDPTVSKARMDTRDGVVVIYNNGNCHIWPADADLKRARFHVLTWPYFAAAQFKLRDPGTRLESMGPLTFNGQPHPAAKLTFGQGVGDSPDDWYIAYADPTTGWLRGMAYIVTYGKDGSPAEAEPHAIMYDDFVRVGSVTLSRRWSFWNWTMEQGIHSEPRGHARVTNIRFVNLTDDWFVAPGNARPLPLP